MASRLSADKRLTALEERAVSNSQPIAIVDVTTLLLCGPRQAIEEKSEQMRTSGLKVPLIIIDL